MECGGSCFRHVVGAAIAARSEYRKEWRQADYVFVNSVEPLAA